MTEGSPILDPHSFTIEGVPVREDRDMPSDKVLVRPVEGRGEGGFAGPDER